MIFTLCLLHIHNHLEDVGEISQVKDVVEFDSGR